MKVLNFKRKLFIYDVSSGIGNCYMDLTRVLGTSMLSVIDFLTKVRLFGGLGGVFVFPQIDDFVFELGWFLKVLDFTFYCCVIFHKAVKKNCMITKSCVSFVIFTTKTLCPGYTWKSREKDIKGYKETIYTN